jgi:hypothetical protein
MTPRTDIITSSRVDLALILLPEITWWEVSCMLAVSGVPEEVAARVLVLPGARRSVSAGVPPAAA